MSYTPAHDRYALMRYNRCGRSGLKLPAIALGLWHNFGGVDVFENGRAMVLRAFDMGITHFDLANNYGPPPGSAEETFGRILKQDLGGHRDEMIISTKAGYRMWPGPYGEWGSKKYLVASLDQSLKRMGLDYVDIFYSHRPDPDTPLEETIRAMEDLARHGKILYWGVSEWPAERMVKANAVAREIGARGIGVNQPTDNMAMRSSAAIRSWTGTTCTTSTTQRKPEVCYAPLFRRASSRSPSS